MTTLRTAAQQALEALEALQGGCTDSNDGTVEAITVWCPEVIDALRAALEQPEQEPVAWRWRLRSPTDAPGFAQPWNVTTYYPREQANEIEPLYTAPPQRKPPLTEEEIQSIHDTYHKRMGPQEFARAIEAALKERNA
jgi:hypothetical protein